MELTWDKQPISKAHHHRHPSFSSTLLDQIYRSIDDNSTPLDSTRKDHHHHRQGCFYEEHDISPNYRRRSIAADFDRSKRSSDSFCLRYSNSNYDSDSTRFFSSDSSGRSKSSTASSPPPTVRPIRTSLEKPLDSKQDFGGFLRKKSKALKIYTDLKKVKQPISPGGKLAAFLNSLFTTAATNPKKQKKTTTTKSEPQYSSSSSCSTASSFSRSCLSKTPTSSMSSEKSKRSVRFCPVNVILDKDYSQVMEEEENRRRVMEAAKEVLRNYQKNLDVKMTSEDNNVEEEEEEEEEDEDDLFELENLSAIGIQRYGQELPVYETTRVDTNRAIASRLLV